MDIKDIMKMWNVSLFLAILLMSLCTLSDSIALAPIHWNASNPMFKTSNNDHIIEVNLYDTIDFVCPYFENGTDPNAHEYYVIHQVMRQEYEDCNLYSNGEKKHKVIVNCSAPSRLRRYTLFFESFSSIPGASEFREGGLYYYITTSTGDINGIDNHYQGACLYRNMKLTFKVCCESTTTTTTTTQSTTTTTHHRRHSNPSQRPSTTTPVVRKTTKEFSYNNDNEVDKNKDGDKVSDENETYPKQDKLGSGARTTTLHLSTGLLLSISILIGYICR